MGFRKINNYKNVVLKITCVTMTPFPVCVKELGCIISCSSVFFFFYPSCLLFLSVPLRETFYQTSFTVNYRHQYVPAAGNNVRVCLRHYIEYLLTSVFLCSSHLMYSHSAIYTVKLLVVAGFPHSIQIAFARTRDSQETMHAYNPASFLSL